MTVYLAPAALINGPTILKTVRTPSALRTGATRYMAGWMTGAYIKAIPISSMH